MNERRNSVPNDPETEALARSYATAAAVGKLVGIWELCAYNITHEDASVHQVYHGLEATKHYYTKVVRELDAHWEVGEIVATAEGFGMCGYLVGRHIGDLPGMPATNRPFKVACATMAAVRNGKIVRTRSYWSQSDLLAQLNLPASQNISRGAR
jgi:predicted ester cyclase